MDDFDQRLSEVLEAKGYAECPNCGRRIDRGDVAWNNGATEAGTNHCTIEIQCQRCDAEIVEFHSWYPSIDYVEELLDVIKDDLAPKAA